jgi:hypothetical protein
MSKGNTKQRDPEYQDVGKQLQPNGQPSLHCNCHDIRSILHVESMFRIVDGSILMAQ